ncbi:hypothetical protein [Methanothermobacter sp.]|uniref:hypothetical protein n=1 Tax=Methanothermobacter sp. TaxID=1884223 RepID=UPI00263557EC|nr:hypothetical protein [Methanothermobacter sp.]MDI9614930.1 hypothetical protein [Methanothermobacter sp.]
MEIQIQRIGLFRPGKNPRSCTLSLDMDWKIDYTDFGNNSVGYIFYGESGSGIPLKFKLEGKIVLEDSEKLPGNLSELLIDLGLNIMVGLFNISRDRTITVQNELLSIDEFQGKVKNLEV